jgi:hypothetical protein
VLGADSLGPIHLGDRVGEAVGFLRLVEVGEELLGEREVVGHGAHDDCALAVDQVDFGVGWKYVAEGGDYLVSVGLLSGIVDRESPHRESLITLPVGGVLAGIRWLSSSFGLRQGE